MMTCAIILNGISRKKKKFYSEIFPQLEKKFKIQLMETRYKGHAISLAREAVRQKFDFILAAGGDGTLNQVVNGMVGSDSDAGLPALGLIPMGTGNDFARTCRLTADAGRTIGLISAGKPLPTDIGKLVCHDEEGRETVRYFINSCSLGMGPAVVQRLEKSKRRFGPSVTYMVAIIKTFFTQRALPLQCSDGIWKFDGRTMVAAISNGKSFGNAVFIAPDAQVDDGLLDVFLACDMPTMMFLACLALLKTGRKIRDPRVLYHSVRSMEISSSASAMIETEGELAGYLPAKIEVVPKKINFFR